MKCGPKTTDGEQTGFRLALTDSTTFRFVPPDIQEMKNWVRLLAGVKATVQQEASMDGKLLGDIPGDILKHDYSLSIKVKTDKSDHHASKIQTTRDRNYCNRFV